jgi:2-succinyl-5-enolpyruvyl-6-hydroxy-3-cyclohexene-1-carboxylate synthase
MEHLRQINKIPQICTRLGVQNFIISPGSRSAPLTVAFSRHPDCCCRVVIDERAAGYVALGLAQQSGQPVGLVCTSGTAALNYGPAIAEAYYQQIPLLVFTADRPPEWLDQRDNQTIQQRGIHAAHCRATFELPVDTTHKDAQWHLERIISQAIHKAIGPVAGPVQINVPLREPLYSSAEQEALSLEQPKVIVSLPMQPTLSRSTWESLLRRWKRANRKLIIVGMHKPERALRQALYLLSQVPTVAVIADITSNIYPDGSQLYHSDLILTTRREATLQELAPDLLVTLGGQVVSKALTLFLRDKRASTHWHIEASGEAVDTYQSLTHLIPVEPSYFCESLLRLNQKHAEGSTSGYAALWHGLEMEARSFLADFLAQAPFGEFQAMAKVMQALPPDSRLQLGNSMSIRYANYLAHLPGMKLQAINANRGTSGIDGTVSTAVGAALATNEITTLITGELAFFYDRNGLWHEHLPPNLRLVILNNHGGGIFKLIDGPKRLQPAERERYFFTPHPLTARRTAADHGCDYIHCNSLISLQQALPDFFAPRERAIILEIETDSEVNTKLFQQFKSHLADAW